MKTIGIAIVSFLILGITPNTQPLQIEIPIFTAFPTVRVVANGTNEEGKSQLCIEKKLSPKERIENAIEIVKRGNRYIWASRRGVELRKKISGIYILFTRVDGGGGYVKFVHPDMIEPMQIKKDELKFMEHVEMSITGISYFGTTFSYTE